MNQQPDSSPVQVLVVDDHALFVESLRARFDQDGRFQVVGTAADGRAAVKLARAHEAAVVLMRPLDAWARRYSPRPVVSARSTHRRA